MRELNTDAHACDQAGAASPRRQGTRRGGSQRMLSWLADSSSRNGRRIRSYHELDQYVRTQLDTMRGEPDLATRTERLAAVARGERDLARLYAQAFSPSTGGGSDTGGQVNALLASAGLINAIVVATLGALGARVALPSWTEAPWNAAAPALQLLATTTDPAARARALDELRAQLSSHLDQTATESLRELIDIERTHARVPARSVRS